ncbi:MAG: MOP flippase family protein [Candidatus Lokiarchaeia archaeon]
MVEDDAFFDKHEEIDFRRMNQKADSSIRLSSISLIYSAISNMLMMIILARLLTPREYGIMGMVLIVIGFGNLFSDIGVSGAVIHYQKVSKRQLSTLYWLTFIIGLIIFIILNLVSPLISIFYNEPELTFFISITAIIFLITPLSQQFETLYRKELKFKSLTYIEILTSTVLVITSIIFAYYGWGVISVILGYLSKTLVKTFLIFFIGLKIWKPSFEFKFKEINNFLSFGVYQIGERSLNYFNSNIDKILIGKFLGAVTLGYYNIAYNLVSYPIIVINQIFTRVSFPYFSKLQNNIKWLKKAYLNLISLVSFINFPIYISLMLISPYFIPLLYGTQWYPSIILVQILSVVFLFRCIANPIGSLLLAKGYARLGFIWNAFVTMSFPFIILLGIIFGGSIEVAISILLSQFIFFYLFYYFLLKKIFGPCLKQYIKSFGIFLLFSVSSLFVGLLGDLVYQFQSFFYQSLYLFLIVSISYLGLVFIFRRQFLVEFFERFFKKKAQ